MSITPESSNNSLPQSLSWLTRHLGKLLWAGLALSLVFFVNWLWITLFAPAFDAQRDRQTVKMADGHVVVVDYPKRFLVQEEPSVIYFTISPTDPVSISLNLPTTLPLTIDEVDPPGSLQLGNIANGQVVISWPISSSLPTTSSHVLVPSTSGSISATTTIPVNGQPSLVVVKATNANTNHGGIVPFISSSYTEASFEIVDAVEKGRVQFGIETTSRANWRLFAEKYSFLAIAPLLIAGLSALGKLYIDQQKERQRLASVELEKLKASISKGTTSLSAEEHLKALCSYQSDLSQEDWERLEKLALLHDGKITQVKDRIFPDDFTKWSDSWAGALAAAASIIFSKERRSEDKLNGTTKSAGGPTHEQTSVPLVFPIGSNDGFAKEQQQIPDAEADAENSVDVIDGAINSNEEILRVWFRVFPRDLLSAQAENRLQVGAQTAGIGNLQEHSWPLPPQPPEKYRRYYEGKLTLQEMRLFPYLDAATAFEQSYLFSTETGWFWGEHHVYQAILKQNRNVVVFGEPGSGRSALAMALSRYADPDSDVLPSCHLGAVSVREVQIELAHQLLSYARWRTTRLAQFDEDDRNLFAKLTLTVLDIHYTLAKLDIPEAAQFETAESESQKSVWKEQAIVEMRLLRQSVRRTETAAMPNQHWFLGISHIAEKLGFRQIRSVLDMTAEEWDAWSSNNMATFLDASRTQALVLPFRFVAMVASHAETNTPNTDVVEMKLEWTKNDLLGMLNYRMLQRGVLESALSQHIDQDAKTRLTDAASGNPRELGRLWREIEHSYPSDTKVTSMMIRGGSAE